METIFLSENIRVKQRLKDSPYCVVTFDSYTDARPGNHDRLAFGERFFGERDVSVIHILNGRNNWYHTPEWAQAMSRVRDVTSRHQRTLAYGSSMGGYAAMRFAEFVGASAILSISPQYHMSRERAPFETRWKRDAKKVRWRVELDHPYRADIPAVIVYDPRLTNDRMHVEYIAREAPVTHLKAPFSGHPSGTHLAECGLLGELVMDVLHSKDTVANIARRARAGRRNSLSYLTNLAKAAANRRPDIAIALARRATEQEPGVYYAWTGLGYVLHRAGRPAEAVAAMERALELAPEHPPVMTAYAFALANNGQMLLAYRVLRRVAQALGRRNPPFFYPPHLWLLARAAALSARRRFGA